VLAENISFCQLVHRVVFTAILLWNHLFVMVVGMPLPSHWTYTHTPKPNKAVDPQLATSQQLQVHATHTKT
jgi:hypothetical protein